jgi:hypothetical protein
LTKRRGKPNGVSSNSSGGNRTCLSEILRSHGARSTRSNRALWLRHRAAAHLVHPATIPRAGCVAAVSLFGACRPRGRQDQALRAGDGAV